MYIPLVLLVQRTLANAPSISGPEASNMPSLIQYLTQVSLPSIPQWVSPWICIHPWPPNSHHHSLKLVLESQELHSPRKEEPPKCPPAVCPAQLLFRKNTCTYWALGYHRQNSQIPWVQLVSCFPCAKAMWPAYPAGSKNR